MHASLIGSQYSGKTLVFQALTGIELSKKEELISTIKIPDERINFLTQIYNPKKVTFAEIILSDYNLPPSKDSIISLKVKNLIQKSDLLIIVLRNFDSTLSEEQKNPLKEYNKIRDELILTDLISIEKRIEREEKEKKNPSEINVIKKLNKILNENKFPGNNDFSNEEIKKIENYSFLSLKKQIVLINQKEGNTEIPVDLIDHLNKDNLTFFQISAILENELNLIPDEEKLNFLASYGLKETALSQFLKHVYKSLGLISFITIGEDEVRAWTIPNGINAQQAAGKIHSDISRGFIRAEVVSFQDFKSYGSEAECKKAGKFRLEGKYYIVQDGNIISFRFNV